MIAIVKLFILKVLPILDSIVKISIRIMLTYQPIVGLHNDNIAMFILHPSQQPILAFKHVKPEESPVVFQSIDLPPRTNMIPQSNIRQKKCSLDQPLPASCHSEMQ